MNYVPFSVFVLVSFSVAMSIPQIVATFTEFARGGGGGTEGRKEAAISNGFARLHTPLLLQRRREAAGRRRMRIMHAKRKCGKTAKKN